MTGASLTVGDVGLWVHSPSVLLDLDNPAYMPFVEAAAAGVARSSSVDIEVLTIPSLANDSPVLFDSGGAWTMQPEGDGYRLSFHRRGAERPHTVVCADADTSRVRVYVDQDVVASDSPYSPVVNPVRYPLDQLLLMNHLAPRGGITVHAAGAVVEGRALVFPGVSGAGKSTLSQLLVGAGLGDSLLSDDRIILRCESDSHGVGTRVEAWGTPWPGDAQIARNAHAPLAALLFLVQAEADELAPLTPGQAMRRLMPVVSCPWYDAVRASAVLDTCARGVQAVPSYDLRFRPEAPVVDLLTSRPWGSGGLA